MEHPTRAWCPDQLQKEQASFTGQININNSVLPNQRTIKLFYMYLVLAVISWEFRPPSAQKKPLPLSLNSSHFFLEGAHICTLSTRANGQHGTNAVTLAQGEWTQGSERLVNRIKVLKLLGTLSLSPTADERRHISKSVFLTLCGEFEWVVSASGRGLVTHINPQQRASREVRTLDLLLKVQWLQHFGSSQRELLFCQDLPTPQRKAESGVQC